MSDEQFKISMAGYREAARRCTDRFMADVSHNRGRRNPFVDGPCDDCCQEVVTERTAGTNGEGAR